MLQPTVFVFDCGGVLVHTSKKEAFKLLGYETVLPRLIANGLSSTRLRAEYLEALHALKPSVERPFPITDELGHVLPEIMHDWMLGNRTCAELIDEVNNLANMSAQLQECPSLHRMLIATCANTLDPQKFIQTQQIDPIMIKLMETLHQQLNRDKSRTHRVFILSNYNDEAFKLLLEKYPELAEHSDGICLSADKDIKCAKPEPRIYAEFMKKYNIDPSKEEVIFIDDQEPNRLAARVHGWICLHPNAIRHRGHGRFTVTSDALEMPISIQASRSEQSS